MPWRPWLGGYIVRRYFTVDIPNIITIISYPVKPNDVSITINLGYRVGRVSLTVPLTVGGQGTVSNIPVKIRIDRIGVNAYLPIHINLISYRSIERNLPIYLKFAYGTVDRRVTVNMLIGYRRVVGSVDVGMNVDYRRNIGNVLPNVYFDTIDTVNKSFSVSFGFSLGRTANVNLGVNLDVTRLSMLMLPFRIIVERIVKRVDNNNVFVVMRAIQS